MPKFTKVTQLPKARSAQDQELTEVQSHRSRRCWKMLDFARLFKYSKTPRGVYKHIISISINRNGIKLNKIEGSLAFFFFGRYFSVLGRLYKHDGTDSVSNKCFIEIKTMKTMIHFKTFKRNKGFKINRNTCVLSLCCPQLFCPIQQFLSLLKVTLPVSIALS